MIDHIGQLNPDQRNARKHNPRNIGMIASALQEVGAARSIVIDEDNNILAGNGTIEAAGQVGIEKLRVIDADGDEIIAVRRSGLSKKAKKRLAYFDNRTAELADWEPEILAGDKDILDGLFSGQELEGLFADLAEEPQEAPEPISVPDALYPTDNEWDIPLLDIRMQAEAVMQPVTKWGVQARTELMPGTYHFYTDDYKFSALWDDPSPIPRAKCTTVVEPNFSTLDTMPRIGGLYRIYQKRWLARYWQECGIRVFVDLNVTENFRELNLLGVPRGWRSYATRVLIKYADLLERDYRTACEHAGTDDILFLVVGGNEATRLICGERGWVHIREGHSIRKETNYVPSNI